MEKKTWWKEAVVYQIYPRSFQDSTGSGVGDLNGITQRLDYLKDLGVDVIWLSPVYASPNVDNGYDISDYRAIMDEFGTMEDFEKLLSESHKRGLKILMDLVVNHSSDRHPWFIESRSSVDNPKRDWYIWRDGFKGGCHPEGGLPNDLRSVFSGSAWTKDEKTGQYYMHNFAAAQPDLNWANPDVRNAIFDMMKWWLDKGVDGFRMDVIDAIDKPASALAVSGGKAETCFGNPGVHEYLKEMNQKVLSRYGIMTVGETSSVTVDTAPLYAGNDGKELNMVFQFEHTWVDHDKTLGKWKPLPLDLPKLKKILSRWQTALHGRAWNSLYWDNHDQPRIVSRFGNDSTEELRVLSAKMLAACLHMMQGTPYIYQGEELGMTNYPFNSLEECNDVEIHNAYRELVTEKKLLTHEEMMKGIRKLSRDNARTPMQWDDGKNAGFSAGTPWMGINPNYKTINAAAQVSDPESVFSFYKRLIRLRKEYPVIVYGDYELLLPEDERLFVYHRRFEDASILVLCNFTSQRITGIDIDALRNDDDKLLIGNYHDTETEKKVIMPYETRVYYSSISKNP
ncbi:oligo-1,6-glucosidase [Spirochaetia bacterium]|nr:oligo-1,6-glucosidase [Spirochaetia bacterium]